MTRPRPQTPAERMRDACVDECVQWEEVFRGRGELDMAGAAKTCARDVGGIPIPTPTPLELAREAFTQAAYESCRVNFVDGDVGNAGVAAADECLARFRALLRAEKEAYDA